MERVGIIARRKMPENLIKKEQAYRKEQNQENNQAISDKACQKVTEKAETQSTADAKIIESFGQQLPKTLDWTKQECQNRNFLTKLVRKLRFWQENSPLLSDKACQKVTEKESFGQLLPDTLPFSCCVWLLLLVTGNCPQPSKVKRVIYDLLPLYR